MANSNQSSPKPTDKPKDRKDWKINNRAISQAVLGYIKDHKVNPTYDEIAKLTGLSTKTVERHFQEMDFDQLYDETRQWFANHADVINSAILNSALKGSASAQKMLLQIAYKWAEPKSMDLTVTNTGGMSDEERELLEKALPMMEKLNKLREKREKETSNGSDGQTSEGDTDAGAVAERPETPAEG